MANGMYSALSGAVASLKTMNVLSNNLANVDTAGYKGQRTVFKEVMVEANGVVNASYRQVKIDEVSTDFSTGDLRVTDNALDVAIIGEGFFEVEGPDGPRYTRAGSFQVGADGEIVNLSGYKLNGDGGPIQIPEGALPSISGNGTIASGELELGKLKVVKFPNPQNLLRAGENLWQVVDGQEPEALEQVQVQPGALERSNVSAVKSMVELVNVSRSYSKFMRAMSTFREVDKRTVTDIR